MAKKKKLKIPKAYIIVDRDFRTRSVRDKETGKFLGRRRVKGYGDRTAVRRVKRGKWSGVILGRTKPIPIRGSNRARGTIRRTL